MEINQFKFSFLIGLIFVFCNDLSAASRFVLMIENDRQNAVISLAKTQIGVREETNKERIAEYLASVGIKGKASWCSAFQYWLQKQIYSQPYYPRSAVANSIYDKAVKTGKKVPYKAEVGDYIVWKNPGSWTGHVGLVIEVSGDQVKTIEGNTSSISVRTGGMVAEKMRHIYHPIGKLKVRGLVGRFRGI